MARSISKLLYWEYQTPNNMGATAVIMWDIENLPKSLETESPTAKQVLLHYKDHQVILYEPQMIHKWCKPAVAMRGGQQKSK